MRVSMLENIIVTPTNVLQMFNPSVSFGCRIHQMLSTEKDSLKELKNTHRGPYTSLCGSIPTASFVFFCYIVVQLYAQFQGKCCEMIGCMHTLKSLTWGAGGLIRSGIDKISFLVCIHLPALVQSALEWTVPVCLLHWPQASQYF